MNNGAEPQRIEADLCIYGGTPAGIAAAVQAGRMGLRAVLEGYHKRGTSPFLGNCGLW
ncbi:FAD-dependent oxidoreductase [Paenibacillus mendelii]|uniref:FAD-dependent oxidoreductase n=1 Tax=Paenibacillus mendelii TaxID=206163 RepID=A0ABV6J2L9_9BACL|nr:FAD-dependent oxidoreductase [Paenibacillus mendelii]MCQ6560534.1 FAD-dependent oxidoreductase [Paenibacillus mendelii]